MEILGGWRFLMSEVPHVPGTVGHVPGVVICTEAGSYLRLIDSCITQLNAQGPSRTCNESKEEEEGSREAGTRDPPRQLSGRYSPEVMSPECPEVMSPECPEVVSPDCPEVMSPDYPEVRSPDTHKRLRLTRRPHPQRPLVRSSSSLLLSSLDSSDTQSL